MANGKATVRSTVDQSCLIPGRETHRMKSNATRVETIQLVDGSTVITGDFVPDDSYFSFCEALAETLNSDPLTVEAAMSVLEERMAA
jgi:hypothetical protein